MKRYEIDNETFEITAYDEHSDIPFLLQPHYPNGDPFLSYNDAKNWVEEYFAFLEIPGEPLLPPEI